jgi:hypothetical protein
MHQQAKPAKIWDSQEIIYRLEHMDSRAYKHKSQAKVWSSVEKPALVAGRE